MNLPDEMYRPLGIIVLAALFFAPLVIRRIWTLSFANSAVLIFLFNFAALISGYAIFTAFADMERVLSFACIAAPLAAALAAGQIMREWSRAKMITRLDEMAPTKGGMGADAASPHEEQ